MSNDKKILWADMLEICRNQSKDFSSNLSRILYRRRGVDFTHSDLLREW